MNSRFRKLFPSTRNFVLAIATVLLSTAFSLLLAEGLARHFHFPFRPKWVPSENAIARFDPGLGWSFIPSQSKILQFGSAHREVPIYIDELGCRVRSPDAHADPSAPSALFVGDSFTFGHGVTYDESFVGRLAGRPDFPLQVVNLGVQGYGTDQSLLLLERQIKKFNTKVVVYTFTTYQINRNEIYDNRLQSPGWLVLGTKPMFALRRDGSLYLARRAHDLKHYSYSHLWEALQVVKLRWGPPPTVRLTRALIQEMKNVVEANGARLIVVDWFADNDFPWGLDVDVVYASANAPPGWNSWIIPGEGHPDPRAHLYVSELIANKVKQVWGTAGKQARPPHRRQVPVASPFSDLSGRVTARVAL